MACVPASRANGRFDVDGDGRVTLADVSLISANWSSLVPYNEFYDMNCDEQVNFQDTGLAYVNCECSEYIDEGACLNSTTGCQYKDGVCSPIPQVNIVPMLLLGGLAVGVGLFLMKRK